MYDYDDDGPSPWRRWVLLASVLVLGAVGWFVVRPRLTGEEATAERLAPIPTNAATPTTTTEPTRVTARPARTEPERTEPTTADTEPERTTTPPTTTSSSTSTSTTSTTSTTVVATFPTTPDGAPEPAIATFDVDTITLTGAVPDQDAADRLAALALANSKTPATIDNQLTINPAVPHTVGVRVIELTSARFPDGSARVEMAHAGELNRVADVMRALPNVTVLVIGHADQRGDDTQNFQLSDDRARSVVNYLVSQGIEGSRLSSRAVGEADLLAIGDDDISLALNRRTEFVFYGLLL